MRESIVPPKYSSMEEYQACLLKSLLKRQEQHKGSSAYQTAIRILENDEILTAKELAEMNILPTDPASVIASLQIAYVRGLRIEKVNGVKYKIAPREDLENLCTFFNADSGAVRSRMKAKGILIEYLEEKVVSKKKHSPVLSRKSKEKNLNSNLSAYKIGEAASKYLRENRCPDTRRW